MLVLIGRRSVLALVTLFIISLIVFLGVEALPGDTATAYLGQQATPESLKALREEFGLNAPIHERYISWLGGVLKGDLGESMVKRKPVVELIGNRFRNTLVLAVAAALVGIPLAIVLGVIAGLMRDSRFRSAFRSSLGHSSDQGQWSGQRSGWIRRNNRGRCWPTRYNS